MTSVQVQDAVLRRLEVIGEDVKNLPQGLKERYPDIEWQKAVGARNILVHDYLGVDLKIVWDTATLILPKFKKQIEKVFKELKTS